jgi:hypothetical protein
MLNVFQYILADEAVVEEEHGNARETVRARLQELGGARMKRDARRVDAQETEFQHSPPRSRPGASTRPGRAAGEQEWKVGTPSEPGAVPKEMPQYMREEAGPNPFPGLAPPVG